MTDDTLQPDTDRRYSDEGQPDENASPDTDGYYDGDDNVDAEEFDFTFLDEEPKKDEE